MINSEPRLLLTRTNFVENAGLKFTSSPHQKLCGGPQPHRNNKYQARNRPAPQALSLFWPTPLRGLRATAARAGRSGLRRGIVSAAPATILQLIKCSPCRPCSTGLLGGVVVWQLRCHVRCFSCYNAGSDNCNEQKRAVANNRDIDDNL
jgi:hypothetical protein